MLKMILGIAVLIGVGFLLVLYGGPNSQRTVVGSTAPVVESTAPIVASRPPVQVVYAQQSTGPNTLSTPIPNPIQPRQFLEPHDRNRTPAFAQTQVPQNTSAFAQTQFPQMRSDFSPTQVPQSTSAFTQTPVPQKTPVFPEHEWVFITKSDELLCGDFTDLIELELKFDYGTAKIPLVDIVSLIRVETKKDEPSELPTAILPTSFSPPPQSAPLPGTTAVEAEAPLEKNEVADEPAAGDKPAISSQIIVATKSGNIFVGQCDLADFHVRTNWGTMTINASQVNTICRKSCGLKRLQQASSTEGWTLTPLRFRLNQVEVHGDGRQSVFASPPNLTLKSPSS